MTYIGGDIRSETYIIFGIVKVKIWDFTARTTARGILGGQGPSAFCHLWDSNPHTELTACD